MKPYRPIITENSESGLSEFVLWDGPTVVRHRPGESYDEVLDMRTRQIVGFQWRTANPPPPPTDTGEK